MTSRPSLSAGATPQRIILRGAMSAGGGFLLRFAGRFLFLAVAARLFGAELLGAFSLAVAVVDVGAMAGGLGMRKLLFRLLDERDAASGRPAVHLVIDAAILVVVASALLAGAIMILMLVLPDGWMAENTGIALFAVAPMIFGRAMIDLTTAATRWKHYMRFEVLSRGVVEPYTMAAVALAAYHAGFTQSGLLLAYSAGTLAAVLCGIAGVRVAFASFELRSYRASLAGLRHIYRTTRTNMLSDLLNALFARLDLFVVGIALGEVATGIYALVRQLKAPINQIRQSFDPLLTPLVSKTLSREGAVVARDGIASVERLLLALQLPVVIALVAIGRPLLDAFGPEFVAGYGALILMVLAELLQSAFGVSELILVYLRPRLALLLTGASIATGLVAGFGFTCLWGLEGAAAAALLTAAARAVLRRHLLGARLGVPASLLEYAGPLIAGLVGIAAAVVVRVTAAPGMPLTYSGLGAAAALLVYGLGLAAWLRLAGQTLAIRELTVD